MTSPTSSNPPKSLTFFTQAASVAVVTSPLASLVNRKAPIISLGFFGAAVLADYTWTKRSSNGDRTDLTANNSFKQN